MLKRLKGVPHCKKSWRERGRCLVKKSVLYDSASSATLNCLSNELMSIETRPTNREEELPWPD
jgi:hypothetical protein